MFLPKGTSKPNGLSPRAENISRRRDIFTKVRCEEILDTPRPLSHGCNSVADLNVNVARQPLWEYSSNSTCSHEYGVISYSIQFTARENFRCVRYSSREKRNFLEIFFSETSSPAQSSLISFSPFFFLPFFLLPYPFDSVSASRHLFKTCSNFVSLPLPLSSRNSPTLDPLVFPSFSLSLFLSFAFKDAARSSYNKQLSSLFPPR